MADSLDSWQRQYHALPPGGVAHHGGDLEDPDFNNVHVEIVWPEPGLIQN